jgi:hypothetical protein
MLPFDPFQFLWTALLDLVNPASIPKHIGQHLVCEGVSRGVGYIKDQIFGSPGIPYLKEFFQSQHATGSGIEICVNGKTTGFMHWRKTYSGP